MKSTQYIWACGLGIFIWTTGCKKYQDPLQTEQFEKTVYLVGANQSNNQGLHVVNLPYKASTSDTADTYISVAVAGSLPTDRNLTVTLAEAGSDAVDHYNRLYLYKDTDIKYRLLNNGLYLLPKKTIELEQGAVYGRMHVGINTAGLHCDSLYALTFQITSVSQPDYVSIRSTDSVLIFSFNLYNQYSGTYQSAGRYYKHNAATSDTTTVALTRTFKAVSVNQLRFYHLTTSENVANVAANGITVTVHNDNTVGVAPWGTLDLIDGGGTYDPATKTFTLWYKYRANGITYEFKGKFSRTV